MLVLIAKPDKPGLELVPKAEIPEKIAQKPEILKERRLKVQRLETKKPGEEQLGKVLLGVWELKIIILKIIILKIRKQGKKVPRVGKLIS